MTKKSWAGRRVIRPNNGTDWIIGRTRLVGDTAPVAASVGAWPGNLAGIIRAVDVGAALHSGAGGEFGAASRNSPRASLGMAGDRRRATLHHIGRWRRHRVRVDLAFAGCPEVRPANLAGSSRGAVTVEQIRHCVQKGA